MLIYPLPGESDDRCWTLRRTPVSKQPAVTLPVCVACHDTCYANYSTCGYCHGTTHSRCADYIMHAENILRFACDDCIDGDA